MIPEYLQNASLNEEQFEAVMNLDGPVMVCAGAGSGKTRVIAYRTLNIIRSLNCPSESILCVTFTNKAAKEMKERIRLILGEEESLPIVTTFHSYGLNLIRRYGSYIGLENCTIIDDEDQKEILGRILQSVNIDKDITVKKVMLYMGFKKNKVLNDEYFFDDRNILILEKIINLYENEKKQHKYIDFDDILIYTLELIKNNHILNKIRQNIRHVLVDEYQDTNILQHEIIKKICLNEEELAVDSLCVVGDEDQSIYSWRGANVSNFKNFSDDFKNTKMIMLTRNYRSVENILSLANNVIEKNSLRNPKNLWTNKKNESSIIIFEYPNGYKEAEGVIRVIKFFRKEKKLGSCAILYRSHYQSRLFEEACVASSIPYKMVGGINFYNRMEVKDILSYIKLFVNNYDINSFIRCCNTPTRGFGEVSMNEFLRFWNNSAGYSIQDAIIEYVKNDKLSERIRTALISILEVLHEMNENIEFPANLISNLINSIQYIKYLEKTESDLEVIRERKENISELIEAAKSFEFLYKGTIYDFIDHVSLMDETTQKDENDKNVTLMSIHAAKGLEFTTVFIVGLEEGTFPSSRSIIDINKMEEERRLLYVAITRAEERLYLSYAKQRNTWGATKFHERSSFFDDFPINIPTLDMSEYPIYTLDEIIELPRNEILEKYSKNRAGRSFIGSRLNSPYSRFKENFGKVENRTRENNSQENFSVNGFKVNQIINHDVFGTGRIIAIEKDYCSIDFPCGIRRIKASFIKQF